MIAAQQRTCTANSSFSIDGYLTTNAVFRSLVIAIILFFYCWHQQDRDDDDERHQKVGSLGSFSDVFPLANLCVDTKETKQTPSCSKNDECYTRKMS